VVAVHHSGCEDKRSPRHACSYPAARTESLLELKGTRAKLADASDVGDISQLGSPLNRVLESGI